MAAGFMAARPFSNFAVSAEKLDFALWDLHVHLTDRFSINEVLGIAKERNVRFGIVEHPGQGPIADDAGLRNYINRLRKSPVLIGLQPVNLGWSKRFSTELLAQIDYVLMDPQTIPLGMVSLCTFGNSTLMSRIRKSSWSGIWPTAWKS